MFCDRYHLSRQQRQQSKRLITFNLKKIMNIIKKILGFVWIALGIIAVYYLIKKQAIPFFIKGGENVIPAIIYTFILSPMIAGALGAFGIYSIQGEYDDKK
jgi:hypothetical protein